MNTAQIWTIITVGIVALAVALIIIIKRGGKIETKYGAIIIPESSKDKSPESRGLFDHLMRKLAEIRDQKYDWFLRQLKEKGIHEDWLVSHEDARYYQQCLGNIVYSGNGIKSIKSVLERELVIGEYLTKRRSAEFEEYIDSITNECMRSSKTYLTNNYHSEMHFGEGQSMNRTISCEYIHLPVKLSEQREALREDIQQVFKYALELNGGAEG